MKPNQEKIMTTALVTRNSSGLVDALFSAIDKLNAKEIDTEHARAIAHTARAIVGIANLELDVMKFRQESKDASLKSLTIDHAGDAPK